MQPRDGVPVVCIDNYQGGRMAVEHLLAQGCRRIGHIAGPLDWWESRQRMQAWKDALAGAGLPVGDGQWVEGNWSSPSGRQAFETLLDSYPEMDAVFVANDQMALGALQTAGRRGIRIPDDLRMVGFDNVPESEFFWPPLTTVAQDFSALGKAALQETIQIVEAGWESEEPIEPRTISLSPELVVRMSSLKMTG
jgi:DNA-binding LacI/PurR family transcriptional regulator